MKGDDGEQTDEKSDGRPDGQRQKPKPAASSNLLQYQRDRLSCRNIRRSKVGSPIRIFSNMT